MVAAGEHNHRVHCSHGGGRHGRALLGLLRCRVEEVDVAGSGCDRGLIVRVVDWSGRANP